MGAGTGNICYPLLPVIYDVSYSQGIRPERPLSVSAVASLVGILCSPVSAATAALVTLLEPDFTLTDVLLVMWPASIAGLRVASFVASRYGKDLQKDQEFKERLAAGRIKAVEGPTSTRPRCPPAPGRAR